ncbi:Hypothetical protein EHI5A_180220 [Entamoeba histolytica KU27]|uniref:Uncharacterized protein n=1 Tax=Entamoeba histolytica KU27 TaxID=885311 RepID=M2Q708_ENTHI|nr:Hypothetical protein EHI5A_180220 [Entamoeba histolytica KU27]
MNPKNLSEGTVCQTYSVRIECNVADSEDDREMVIVPLILGQGTDWDKINPEMFQIKDINITINSYYQNSMIVNQSIEWYISGDYPMYVQAFAGNTYNEGDATKMNELIFTGIYLSAKRKKKEGVEEKYNCKGKMQHKPEPSEDNKYVDTPVGGKLILNYQAFIRAEITIAYTRKPY